MSAIWQRIVLLWRTRKTTSILIFCQDKQNDEEEKVSIYFYLKLVFIFHYKIIHIHLRNIKNKGRHGEENKISSKSLNPQIMGGYFRLFW